ncbi:hypothetical protein ANN_06830 [Periplaneta americana]|uniref:Uncharacterized protein n=1 Tax=Periplaneta americana TaxID=6978 RepID=A0ABQ8TEK5_PERAM|nr:hypothetical protein ANN_06830 [Periplaneta americana]
MQCRQSTSTSTSRRTSHSTDVDTLITLIAFNLRCLSGAHFLLLRTRSQHAASDASIEKKIGSITFQHALVASKAALRNQRDAHPTTPVEDLERVVIDVKNSNYSYGEAQESFCLGHQSPISYPTYKNTTSRHCNKLPDCNKTTIVKIYRRTILYEQVKYSSLTIGGTLNWILQQLSETHDVKLTRTT